MGTVFTILVIAVIVILVIFAISTYNGLVKRPKRGGGSLPADRRAAQTALRPDPQPPRRREEVLPARERGDGRKVTRARSQAMQPQSAGDQAQSEAQLSGAIGNLFAVAENYPDLKSDRGDGGLSRGAIFYREQDLLRPVSTTTIPCRAITRRYRASPP